VSPEFAALVVRFVEGERFNVRLECDLIGCSRSTFYEYVERFRKRGVEGFYPGSRRPLTSPHAVTSAVEDLVVRARKELIEDGWDEGADSIWFVLDDLHRDTTCGSSRPHRRELLVAATWPEGGAAVPSRATINRILTRRGQVVAVPQRRPKTSTRRFEADQPNSRWQMDGFQVALADTTVVCVLHIVDDCSRLDIALHGVHSENGADVWATFQAAAARYGLPAELLTDNGTAFSGTRRGWTSALTENLTALGICHPTSSVAHPQTCGKCERAHRTVRKWLRRRPPFATLADLNDALEDYRILHNRDRRRRHLNGLTPADRYDLGPTDGPAGRPVATTSITTKTVTKTGTILFNKTALGIGRAHAGKSVTVIRQAQRLTIIGESRLIAEATLKHGSRYQSANPTSKTVSAKS
jgi:transposase InsO family protein